MNLSIIARVLQGRRTRRRHEHWSEQRLREHQRDALAELRSFAYARSPFYRGSHRGLTAASLADLPVLTKAELVGRFDDISTDRAVHLRDLEAYLEALRDDSLFAGRYWVASTSGSSGQKSIIPHDAREWANIISSYARANEWAGIKTDLVHHVKMAVVSSVTPWHQSSRVAATLQSPLVAAHRIDAGTPLAEIVATLNKLRPDVLVAYASMIRILAEEQLAGRLRIAPRGVNCSSEVLTAEARALATRAWRVAPFNVYAATETGGIAAECPAHRMHLFDDLVLSEVVDDRNRPVPPGTTGHKLLVTVLFSRTIPLIRYELTDRVRLAPEPCPCGRTFRVIAAIEGRTDDVLVLRGRDGKPISVHPIVFIHALDPVPCAGWQVRHEMGRLNILVAAPPADFDARGTETAVEAALAAAGVDPLPVRVSIVASIPPGAAGKRPLIVADRAAKIQPQ